MFGTTRMVGRQPYAPATFTSGTPGTHFQRLSRPQGTWFRRGEPRKKPPVTPPGIDPGTVRLVALSYPRPHDLHDVKLMTTDMCINNVSYSLLTSTNVKYVRTDRR